MSQTIRNDRRMVILTMNKREKVRGDPLLIEQFIRISQEAMPDNLQFLMLDMMVGRSQEMTFLCGNLANHEK